MGKEKYNLLALGSCRICTVLNYYQNTYNTWHLDRERKCVIGRSWSINEQLELLKLIKGDKPFAEYVGCELPDIEQVKDNLLFLRQEYNKIDAIVVEVSTHRYFQSKDGKMIHNIEHYSEHSHVIKHMTAEEFQETVRDFVEYSNKPIFFVSHFDRKNKPFRTELWDDLNTVSSEYENVFLIDTTLMPNLQITPDREHYTDAGRDNAIEYIGDNISQTLYTILRR